MIDRGLLTKFNRVAIACSGGKDSMALLVDMAEHFPNDFFYVINVEHGIRGEESRGDSDFVEKYAKSLGVSVKRFDVDAVAYSKEHGYTLEQGARLLRREIFRREVEAGNAERVVVAHHMDDNVESVLMHIFRGSGMRGIKGMSADDGVLLRPMLSVTRADIDDYIARHNIPYREDSTNSDTTYRRNYIRHDIMPSLRARYPKIDSSIMRLSSSIREDEEYMMSEARRFVTEDGDRVLVDISAPSVLMKRALYMAFSMLGVTADIEERHYNLLLDLRDREAGTSLDMPYGVTATHEYDKIALYRETEKDADVYPLMLGTIKTRYYDIVIREHEGDIKGRIENGYRVLYADADKLADAIVRTRQDGDMFKKYKGGNKKLKEYFIDKKIPSSMREVPLIARGKDVLVVLGYEISDGVCVSDSTSKIYEITLRRRHNEEHVC